MYYVIGLQNPGKEYEHTPHSIGGEIMRIFWDNNQTFFQSLREEKNRKRHIATGMLAETDLAVILSDSFMNTSGTCVSDVSPEDAENVVVVYDDIDLPFGEIRISFDRGDGGHNGIKDIIAVLGTKEFIRIRIGVSPTDWFGNPRKPKGRNAINNYLTKKKLSKKYIVQYASIYSEVENMIIEILKNGRQAAMNKFN